MSKKTHILIIRLSALGDVAMTVPVIRALRDQHPDLTITVISKPFHEVLFQTLSGVNFIGVDTKNKHKGIFGLWQLYLTLKQLHITHIADFHNVLRSKILLKFFVFSAVKKAKIDKGRHEKNEFICKIVKPSKNIKTTFERYQAVLSHLGFEIDLNHPSFPIKQTDILNKLDLKNTNQLIGFAPFAHYQTKTYPIDLSRKFLEICHQKHWQILLFGGKNELNELNVLAKNLENVLVIAGKIDFKEEISLISNLNLMISMDSANAHLAAMQGVKVITLWGNTHPMLGFSPFHQPNEFAIISDMQKHPLIPTSVFGNKKVEGYDDVMRSILPETIITLTEKIIKKS